MTGPPALADRKALNRQRARAAADPALFLHAEAATELQERLGMVNRTFTSAAIVCGWPAFWHSFASDRGLEARIVTDDQTLDLSEGAHDLIMHAMALHWADDPVGQLVQCRRALRPDGLFLGVLFGAGTLADLRACLAEAEVAETGGLSPRVLPMGDLRDLGGLLQRAGFALPVADLVTTRVTYPGLFALMRDLRAMGEGNALTGRLRHFTRRRVLDRARALYQTVSGLPDGRVTATFDLVVLTGWAPAEGQPKPLRPGSATARLADVLMPRDAADGRSAPGTD